MNLPIQINSGCWKEGHVQGHIYFSFTTILLKTDLQGNPLGSLRNLEYDPASDQEEKAFSSQVGLYRMDKAAETLFVPCE